MSEAIRIADVLERMPLGAVDAEAAALLRSQDALIKELAGALRKTRWALESCSTKPAPGFGRVDEPITVMIQEYSQIMVEESLKDVNAALAKVKQ